VCHFHSNYSRDLHPAKWALGQPCVGTIGNAYRRSFWNGLQIQTKMIQVRSPNIRRTSNQRFGEIGPRVATSTALQWQLWLSHGARRSAH
jgi:hypothetical protein